jgi:hypothetical protein
MYETTANYLQPSKAGMLEIALALLPEPVATPESKR